MTNRGHDSIALFHRVPKTGMIRFVECVSSQGLGPRSFALNPNGDYLYCSNRKSDNVTVYRIDPRNGRVTPTGQIVKVPEPVCLTVVGTRLDR